MNQEFEKGSKFRVLVVEDEIIIARSLCEDLSVMGCSRSYSVSDGEAAIESVVEEAPDLILMDIRLAGKMDGIETARKIHEYRKIPIVFMSGYTTDTVKKEVGMVEYRGFLEKPLDIHKLKKIVSDVKQSFNQASLK